LPRENSADLGLLTVLDPSLTETDKSIRTSTKPALGERGLCVGCTAGRECGYPLVGLPLVEAALLACGTATGRSAACTLFA
jgi:hypothetical protein